MKKLLLILVLIGYTAYIVHITSNHPQLDYMQKMMYTIVQDSYFIGCRKSTTNSNLCRAASEKYRKDFENSLGELE